MPSLQNYKSFTMEIDKEVLSLWPELEWIEDAMRRLAHRQKHQLSTAGTPPG